MADNIVVGAASIEVRAPQDKINDDFKKISEFSKKEAQKIENSYSKIKIQMDAKLAKMELSKIKGLHKQIKTQLENEIHLNLDKASINRTKAQLKSIETHLESIRKKSSVRVDTKGVGDLYRGAVGLAGGLGIVFGATELIGAGVEAVKLAAKAEGVKSAFDKINQPNLLNNLRSAVQNTISDVELMQAAVRADKFNVGLEKLPVYFEFAKKRASETGQEVGYLVNSIVDGIGRKSTLVMDNLGISASELQQEIKKVGDFGLASGNIIERELNKMGDVALTSADKIAQIGAGLDNAKAKLGSFLIEVTSGFLELAQMSSAEGLITNHADKVVREELAKLKAIDKSWNKAINEARGSATENTLGKSAAEIQRYITEVERKINSLKESKTEFFPSDNLKLQQLHAKLESYKSAHADLVYIFDPYKHVIGEVEDRIDWLGTKIKKVIKGSPDWIKFTSEKDSLENFLKPKTDKATAVVKVNLELEADNLEDSLNSHVIQQRIEDYIKNAVSINPKDFNVLGSSLIDLILGDISPEDAEVIFENIIEKTKLYQDERMKLSEKVNKALDDELQREREIHNLRMNSISEFGNALEGLGSHGKTLVSYFNAALQAALRIVYAVGTMSTDKTSGVLGIFSGLFGFATKFIPGLAQGGSVTNSGGSVSIQPYKKFATGASGYMVPPGFNRDNYIIGVQSGERVDVTPANQVGNSNVAIERGLRDVYNRIGALTEVVRGSKANLQVINSSPDIESKIVELKRKENRMSKRGMNFTDV